MPRFKMPPQIVRLALLTVGIVGCYLVARYLLTPDSFGEFGWYRGRALEEVAARPPSYAGENACDACHADEFKVLAKFEHKNLSCESCHGASQAHVEDPDVKTVKFSESRCLRCHEGDAARPAAHAQIKSKDHFVGDRCAECHPAHRPNDIIP